MKINFSSITKEISQGVQSLANLDIGSIVQGQLSVAILVILGFFLLPYLRLFISPFITLFFIIWNSLVRIIVSIIYCITEILMLFIDYFLVLIRGVGPRGVLGGIITGNSRAASGMSFVKIFLIIALVAGYFILFNGQDISGLKNIASSSISTF